MGGVRHVRTAIAATLFAAGASYLVPAAVATAPASAATVTPPDMTIKVPTNLISIGLDSTTGHRMLRFTHLTEDSGTGPFEMVPTYNSTTGISTFVQYIYNSPSAGQWSFDHSVPLAQTGTWVAPSHYNFPLTSFTLHSLNSDGSLGAVVATSPKSDYCITGDVNVGDVPNTPSQTFIPTSNCDNPTLPLGWSVGWADQYDQTDPGQPIDVNSVPDGTYVLRGVVDPEHVFTESDNTNNVTDTTVQISGSTVTVVGQTHPTVVPPTATLTSPADGSTVSGTVNLSATPAATSPATVSSVQFLLDGQPLGPPVTSAPWTYAWTVGSTPAGTHTLSARVTDSAGTMGSAPVETVTVAAPTAGGPAPGFGIDRTVSSIGTGTISTAAFSTTYTGETLLGLVASDGPATTAGQHFASVTGAGLTWTRVRLANTVYGDSEIWAASAPTVLSSVTVTATPALAGYDDQLTVVSLGDAGGVGGSAAASASSGPQTVSWPAAAAGSLAFAVGNDWDRATARTPGTGQALIQQRLDYTVGDTYWAQDTVGPATTAAGQTITMNDTAPTTDRWNLAGVEVIPAAAAPSTDTTPPSVAITNPVAGQTVSSTQAVAATASDNVGVASVQFFLDGTSMGPAITTAPYAMSWNTTTATNGSHSLTALAIDTSGNQTTSSPVAVTVSNPTPPMVCFVMQGPWTAHGTGSVTTTAFSTAMAGEVLLAFVSADGPASSASQTAKVSGAGLTWTRVALSNAQYGDSEIWAATAPTVLSSVTVNATLARTGYSEQLAVVAMESAKGTGATAVASAATGAAAAKLTTTGATSLVFAVGNDWDNAIGRTLPVGDVMLNQYLNTSSGDTFWSEYTNQPTGAAGTAVTIGTTGPTTDRWNMAAVELLNSGV